MKFQFKRLTRNELDIILIYLLPTVGSILVFLETDNQNINSIMRETALIFVLACIAFIYIQRRNKEILGGIEYRHYTIGLAHQRDLGEIAKLQRYFYPDDAVPIELYQEWFDANSAGFFVIEVENTGELVGHMTFLSIKPERLNLYKDGEILETELRGCDLVPAGNDSVINHIYVESLIIKKAHRQAALPNLLRLLPSMVALYAGSCSKTSVIEYVYAMAATDDGESLLVKHDFRKVTSRSRPVRKDKHEMYCAPFSDFIGVINEKAKRFNLNTIRRNNKANGGGLATS